MLPVLPKQNKTKKLRKKLKSLTQLESNPRSSTCKGNALSIAQCNQSVMSNQLYSTFLCPRDTLFKMVQKMQSYDEMSTTKGHP